MEPSEKRKDTRINLGLDELIGGVPSEVEPDAGTREQPHSAAVQSDTAPNALSEILDVRMPSSDKSRLPGHLTEENLDLSPYNNLANAGSWDEIIRLSESHLSDSTELGIEANLWWVSAHLEKGDLPPSVLAAPLKEIFRNISNQRVEGALIKFCTDLLVRVGNILIGTEHLLEGVELLQSAAVLDSDRTILLEEQIPALIEKYESIPEIRRDEDTKTILNALSAVREKYIKTPSKAKPIDIDPLDEVLARANRNKNRGDYINWRLAALTLGVIIACLWWYGSGTQSDISVGVALIDPQASHDPVLPQLDDTRKIDELALISSSLEEKSISDSSESSVREVTQEPQIKPELTPPTKIEKEKIDISEPKEPPSVRRAIRGGDQRRQDSGYTKSDRGRGDDSTDETGDKLFGQRIPKKWDDDGRGGSGVTMFKYDRRYKVIDRTAVRRGPGDDSKIVEGLRPGDEVRAEGIDHGWLIVSNRSGERGYVNYSDVEPE